MSTGIGAQMKLWTPTRRAMLVARLMPTRRLHSLSGYSRMAGGWITAGRLRRSGNCPRTVGWRRSLTRRGKVHTTFWISWARSQGEQKTQSLSALDALDQTAGKRYRERDATS